MLSDNNINDATARYWCVFAQKPGAKNVNETVYATYRRGRHMLREGVMTRMTTSKDEDFADSAVDVLKAAAGRCKNEAGYIVKGLNQKEGQKVAEKLIGMLDGDDAAGAKAAARSIAKELGEAYGTSKSSVAGSALVKAARGMQSLQGGSKSWFGRFADVLKGYWNNIAGFMKSWFLYGKNQADVEKMGQAEKLQTMLTVGGLHVVELAAAIYVIWKTKEYTVPRLKLAWKNLRAGKPLAVCRFEDTEGEEYQTYFDQKRMRWILRKDNGVIGALFKSSDALFVDQQTADGFFKTDFFKKFSARCRQFIEPMFAADPENHKSTDKNMAEFLKENEESIRQNMFENKYMMFESKRKR